jgi:hypothetical protein
VTLELTNSYLTLFIIAACAYPLAILLIHLFAPRMKLVTPEELDSKPMPRGVTAFLFAILGFVVGVPLSFFFQNQSYTLAGLPKEVGSMASTVPSAVLEPIVAASQRGFTFVDYIASVLPPGNIFKSYDRLHLLPPLLATPLITLVVGALLGALIHPVLFPNRKPVGA